MFAAIDNHDDQDAAKLTTAEQDQVVDECFNCKLCYVNCPNIPGKHEWELDFPRLMLRAEQKLSRKPGRLTVSVALTDQATGSTDLAGKNATAAEQIAHQTTATPAPRATTSRGQGNGYERKRD